MMAQVIDPAGMIEPIEISNSPAIIKRPMGMATMPSWAATFSQLAAPVGEAKLVPPKAVKNRKTAARPRKDPVSGRRIRLPNEKLDDDDMVVSPRRQTMACPARMPGRRSSDQRTPAATPARVASTVEASTIPGPVRI
jgi:hypothetical protein